MKSKVATAMLMLAAVAFAGPWSPAPAISKFAALVLILVAGAFIGPWSRVVAFATIAGIIAVVLGILVGDPDDLESAAYLAVASFAGGMFFGALIGAKVNEHVSRREGRIRTGSWTGRSASSLSLQSRSCCCNPPGCRNRPP